MDSVRVREGLRLPISLPNIIPYLPEGSPLPANVWLSRHRAILGLVWVQAIVGNLVAMEEAVAAVDSRVEARADDE